LLFIGKCSFCLEVVEKRILEREDGISTTRFLKFFSKCLDHLKYVDNTKFYN